MQTAILRTTLFAAAMTLAFDATAAQRTFVSTSGSDANTASNCSNTAPCRSFGSALTVTDTGGEIIVLSSGGYGPVTINKSVSIIAPEGIYAGISVSSYSGISIATAGVDVTLKGLTINGLGVGVYGILMTSGNSLTVQSCAIRNFTSVGVSVETNANVSLLDSHLEGNYYSAHFTSGATVLVAGSRIVRNVQGLWVGASTGTKVDVIRSEASGNTYSGFWAQAGSTGTVELNIKDSAATRNGGAGVYANSGGGTVLTSVSGSLMSGNASGGLLAGGPGARLVATGNTVTRNSYGLIQTASGVLQSTGDNTVTDNVSGPTSGTITPFAKM